MVRRGRIGQDPAKTVPLSIRIGGVPYGVGAPLLAGLESDPAVDFVAAPPARLIEQLRAGQLDAALVSSIEAARVPGYRAPATLGIACKREIRSVRAFRRKGVPIRNIGLDDGSATSVALLRILLARRYADEMAPAVSFTPIAPTTQPDALPYDLVLLIGDKGLAADPGAREVWDLGQQWRALTGMPFVFALWLLRPGADAERIAPILQRARQRGRALGPVDGTAGAAHYELDAEDLRGVHRFWEEAQALGLATAARPAFLTHPMTASS
jgi:chorismate dehydratase